MCENSNRAKLTDGTIYIDHLPNTHHGETTGINWAAIIAALAVLPAQPGDPRFVYLGRVEDLLPSGKWYTGAQIGETVTEAAAADLEYMRALRAEAAALGLGIETDETGNGINVMARTVEMIELSGARYVMTKTSNRRQDQTK